MKISRCFFAAPALFAFAVLVIPASFARADAAEKMTPLLFAVHDAPVPFMGSDGHLHLVYELAITNFSSAEISVEKVQVLGDGGVLQTLDAAAIASRLQSGGVRDSSATMAKSSQALLFLNVILASGAKVPQKISHRIWIHADAAPSGQQERTEEGGVFPVDHQPVVSIGPPLRGQGYISADSCCDAVRHTRAALAVNGRVWVAQRYAVDWEQLDASGRIYSGPREKLESYAIFGQQAIAVANATVVSTTDGLPEQHPGEYPKNIPLEEADGNSVVLDLGGRHYALYAHMQPGSIRVHRGQRVVVGQVIGLVGNTGNSVAPHLHFQVTDGPLSMASNGLPYEIHEFQLTGKTPGTAAFDDAEANGTPLAITPVAPPETIRQSLPLDQLIISFSH